MLIILQIVDEYLSRLLLQVLQVFINSQIMQPVAVSVSKWRGNLFLSIIKHTKAQNFTMKYVSMWYIKNLQNVFVWLLKTCKFILYKMYFNAQAMLSTTERRIYFRIGDLMLMLPIVTRSLESYWCLCTGHLLYCIALLHKRMIILKTS
jgi:hypothetical protein